MKQQLEQAVTVLVTNLFGVTVPVALNRTDERFGDFATNVAMQLAKELGLPPREIAGKLAEAVQAQLSDRIQKVDVAGPGFINLTLTDNTLLDEVNTPVFKINSGQKVLLEYSCPNAFKELHTGHFYQTIIGDALGILLEATGADVYRANFGGDVGLHVAKCLYAITAKIGEDVTKLTEVDESDRPTWISNLYVAGAKAYESDESAKLQIDEINKKIYAFHSENDTESPLAQIYWTCREWSYDYFKSFYESVSVAGFDKYYPESQTADLGLAIIKQHMDSVFTESDGAIVFKGEAVGLHTRVFVTTKGLPTYEAKDLGVIQQEIEDYPYDRRILMTGNDQTQYMQVIFAALNQINPELAAKQSHLTNGTIRFGSGEKMSSRLGNVSRAADVLTEVNKAVTADDDETRQAITLGAIKYSFLKHRLGGDIAFDINESVSLDGNSGPYLQYAYARACSIIRKAEHRVGDQALADLEAGERLLVRKLSEFNEVVIKATEDLMPHLICTYLYELAQTFNRFYEQNRVIGHERELARLELVKAYAKTLQTGLRLLGIPTPEKM